MRNTRPSNWPLQISRSNGQAGPGRPPRRSRDHEVDDLVPIKPPVVSEGIRVRRGADAVLGRVRVQNVRVVPFRFTPGIMDALRICMSRCRARGPRCRLGQRKFLTSGSSESYSSKR